MSNGEGRKRRFNPTDEDSIPDVERLYRENQPSFARAGGFVAETNEEVEKRKRIVDRRKKELAAIPRPDVDDCEKCGKMLLDSWLWTSFALPVCDECKDPEGEHKLISRTQVKDEYLLKDDDLDLRKPPLRYIARKNPHNPRYGDMKLYVKKQIVDRMLVVHGSFEGLEMKKESRKEAKEKRAEIAFDAKVKEMRQHMRGAVEAKAKSVVVHKHEFEEERHVKDDEYEKKCKTCDYRMTYEKM
ncbi:hypothetical protein PFISCL1PPCAC_19601 [Pristionchus fissidentatus]|uniref:XPA C-terminal domain-containing protein n=1 Tax=Pristionchus fissidentatus TaxID=1538716 RepID=A0AAV5WC52_9BILA|nr:hypothetical protein PFISCL1PPCAC_19601 [Pristionchus fissidentatus]